MRWHSIPGKSGMFVMAFIDTERKTIPDIAGFFIRGDDTAKQGDAPVLGLNSSSVKSGRKWPE